MARLMETHHQQGGTGTFTLRSFSPSIGCGQAPSMLRGRVHDMKEKRIELKTQQMTALINIY
jgi:hypothetical protein